MRKIIYLLTLLPLLCACSHIADDEQLIYVPAEAAKRTVLLEDFTGQRCVNCPLGTEVIEQLQEEYGENIVAVGIYSGGFGKQPNGKLLPLTTETGCEYFDHYVSGYGQPIGMVNRHGAVNYTDWTAKVREELARESSVSIQLEAQLVAGQISIDIQTKAINTPYSGNLQVWVLEDGITDTQYMPNGTINKEYVHNHVLRTPVNGTWGDPISLDAGEQKTQHLTQAISSNWNTQKLSIVAFVYNDSGVEQASKVSITQ